MTAGIQEKPAGQGRRIRMVAQQPQGAPAKLVGLLVGAIAMDLADSAGSSHA
jgi:hypothetical protein